MNKKMLIGLISTLVFCTPTAHSATNAKQLRDLSQRAQQIINQPYSEAAHHEIMKIYHQLGAGPGKFIKDQFVPWITKRFNQIIQGPYSEALHKELRSLYNDIETLTGQEPKSLIALAMPWMEKGEAETKRSPSTATTTTPATSSTTSATTSTATSSMSTSSTTTTSTTASGSATGTATTTTASSTETESAAKREAEEKAKAEAERKAQEERDAQTKKAAEDAEKAKAARSIGRGGPAISGLRDSIRKLVADYQPAIMTMTQGGITGAPEGTKEAIGILFDNITTINTASDSSTYEQYQKALSDLRPRINGIEANKSQWGRINQVRSRYNISPLVAWDNFVKGFDDALTAWDNYAKGASAVVP